VPRISEFYGIAIWMYRPDHPPAHFHAQYGDMWAQVAIEGLRVLTAAYRPERCASCESGR
jgi:Domain of unknown function (DUF4160)